MQRTRFKDEIVSEFLVPEEGTNKVVILAAGAPTYPGKGKRVELAKFLMKRGYAVFIPRYRGSWESGGVFLEEELQKDLLDILDELPSGFTDAWSQEEYKIEPKDVTIIGGSFGGPAAFFAALDDRVTRVISVCPVVDWTAESIDEPFDFLLSFMDEAFGEAYRSTPEIWKKLERGEIYNPVSHVTELKKVADKIWTIYVEDDRSVLPGPIKQFVEDIGCETTMLKKGGHGGDTYLMKWRLRRKMLKYLNS